VNLFFNQVDAWHLYLGDGSGKGVCHGDSGGPSFHTFNDGVERLVGVHSYTQTEACTDGADVRVDRYAGFIDQWFADKEGPSCGSDGQCVQGCAPVDPDCVCQADGQCNPQCPDLGLDPDCPADCGSNGICARESCPVVDPDCVAEGSACTDQNQCQARLCIGDPQHSAYYCSRPCASSADCPATMECLAGANVCRYAQAPTRNPGESCVPGQDFCSGGTVCSGPAQGGDTCQASCTSDAQCPGDATCEPGAGGVDYCQAPYVPPTVLRRAQPEGEVASGCSAVGGGSPWALLGLLGLGALRTRRTQR
jgi:MYXO-CTERM domain-containing protein